MVTATATVFLVIVSIFAVIVAMLSIKSQEKHSKNNAKPICSIRASNYDNFISVRIENNGTGPLILNSIKCACDSGIQGKSLFDLLPKDIKHMEYHRVFLGIRKRMHLLPKIEFV